MGYGFWRVKEDEYKLRVRPRGRTCPREQLRVLGGQTTAQTKMRELNASLPNISSAPLVREPDVCASLTDSLSAVNNKNAKWG